jgi:hypothetical protein
MPEKLLTLREVGEILGWRKSRMHRAVTSGEIPSILLSSGARRRSWRVRPSVLEKWVKEREVGHAS